MAAAMRGNKGHILGAALLAAVLTGCEAVPFELPFLTALLTTQSEPEPQTPEDAEAPAQPAPLQDVEPKSAALPPVPAIDDDPARILGLGPEKLSEILGVPELTRREPPAEIWQYRGETCVFDVFLYEEAGATRVTYLEARDHNAQRVAERNCLNQLLRARLAKPLG
jgi:hypothetical protein